MDEAGIRDCTLADVHVLREEDFALDQIVRLCFARWRWRMGLLCEYPARRGLPQVRQAPRGGRN